MQVNRTVAKSVERTHEGAPAKRITPEHQLRRSVLSCLLWEGEFYEDGASIAKRIADLVPIVDKGVVAALAVEARTDFKLRHVPLLLCRELARHGSLRAETLCTIIQRADELSEFLAMYWMDGRCPLSAQVKKGLGDAFKKFNAYSLAKYNRDGAVRLRDVLFMTHAKPKDAEQAETWKKLVEGRLETPDTWEVALSGGADKKEAFARLLAEKKLGALALLRNLRNMLESGVDDSVIRAGLAEMDASRVLPYRFISAARYAPRFEPEIEGKMLEAMQGFEKIPGKTMLLVDVSGSMDCPTSDRSEITRMDAACALAIIMRELCEDVQVLTFSHSLVEVAPRRGFALRDAIVTSQHHNGTYLGQAITTATAKMQYDRIVVFTDEQSHDTVPGPKAKGYMINVASCKNGVGYGQWVHQDGFSEGTIRWIMEYEKSL